MHAKSVSGMGAWKRTGWAILSATALMTTACAGGGSSFEPMTLNATPLPPPPPPPPPSDGQAFVTPEYEANYALETLRARIAYVDGGTGAGVTVAVIDTGIDSDHPELIGNLHPASTDIVAARGDMEDSGFHGTFVSGIIAAARDGEGVHGIAFDSQIMSIRADTDPDRDPNDACVPGGDCGFNADDVMRAIDYAVANGADIINLSLGGHVGDLLIGEAMERAARAGVLLVVAAGNENVPFLASPASYAGDPDMLGMVVAVGATDENNQRAWFSNGAEDQERWMLMAPGVNIISTAPVGTGILGDNLEYGISQGTSFAAPYVAGALALLLDAFPGLTPARALDLLFETATDLGDPGPDIEYGMGLVNLEEAFRPQGQAMIGFNAKTSKALVGTVGSGAVPLDQVLAPAHGAFGDFMHHSGVLDNAIFRDAYDRGFRVPQTDAHAMTGMSGSFEGAADHLRVQARSAATPFGVASFRPGESLPQALADRDMATLTQEGSMRMTHMTGRTTFSMGQGFAAPTETDGAGGAILTAPGWAGRLLSFAGDSRWASLGYRLGRWSLTSRVARAENAQFHSAALSRDIAGHKLALEVGEAEEDNTALGGMLMSRFGDTDETRSTYTAVSWNGAVAGGWKGAARVEVLNAQVETPDYVDLVEAPVATSWSVGAHRPFAGGLFGVTFSQPARAETGAIELAVPTGIRDNGVSIYEDRIAGLTPSGREKNVEASVQVPFAPGAQGQFALRLTDDAGHVKSERTDASLWLGLRVAR